MPLRPFDACIDGLELRHQILKGTYVDQGRFWMRHRQIRRADSNSPRQDEQGRTPFERGPTDEALGFGPPGHRHESVLLDFTALLGQSVRSNAVETSTLSG